jgi:ribosomal protein S7p/S5e
MSRKQKTPVRDVLVDPVFKSKIITKLINTIMLDGKKSVAESILYNSFEIIKTKTNKDPLAIFNLAMENISPQLEVRSRRVGGSNYQVPVEVSTRRKQTLALR